MILDRSGIEETKCASEILNPISSLAQSGHCNIFSITRIWSSHCAAGIPCELQAIQYFFQEFGWPVKSSLERAAYSSSSKFFQELRCPYKLSSRRASCKLKLQAVQCSSIIWCRPCKPPLECAACKLECIQQLASSNARLTRARMHSSHV